ncbi:MAG: hypothetical protein IAF58_08085 [Leptolyngbya sp.]|nr:hypothetical protein [Candidatus Melainabacteria bacterium]
MKAGLAKFFFMALVASTASANAADTDLKQTDSSKSNISRDEALHLSKLADVRRQLHHTLARVKKASSELQNEFNRSDIRIVEYDEYINKYIDGKPVPFDEQLYPYGFQNIGNTSTTAGTPLPARKLWVDSYVNQIDSLVSIIKNDIEQVLADFTQEENIAARSAVLQLGVGRERLLVLGKDSDYKKAEFVDTTNSIKEASDILDRLLKKSFQNIHKKLQNN